MSGPGSRIDLSRVKSVQLNEDGGVVSLRTESGKIVPQDEAIFDIVRQIRRYYIQKELKDCTCGVVGAFPRLRCNCKAFIELVNGRLQLVSYGDWDITFEDIRETADSM